MPYLITHGDEFVAEHARAGQGIPWRCSTAAFLRRAATTIDALDPVTTRQRFSTQHMVDLHVYKAPLGDDDEQFDEVLPSLRDLSAYYRTIANQGLDLIFILD